MNYITAASNRVLTATQASLLYDANKPPLRCKQGFFGVQKHCVATQNQLEKHHKAPIFTPQQAQTMLPAPAFALTNGSKSRPRQAGTTIRRVKLFYRRRQYFNTWDSSMHFLQIYFRFLYKTECFCVKIEIRLRVYPLFTIFWLPLQQNSRHLP